MHSKKFLVAILSLVMVCAFGLFFVACDDDNANEIKSVTLNQTEAALEVGQTLTLTASIDPVTATGYTISWSSDAESVAVVAEGVVRAVASGAATITAKVGEVSATCKVTVTDPSEVSTVEELTSKIEETGVAKLMADMTYSGATFPLNEKDTVIDLNGHTLTVNTEVSTTLSGNRSLTIRGGELVLTQEDDYYGTRGVFAPETGAVVTVEDVVFTTNGTAFFPRGDAAAVSVIDSEIYAPVYCVGTNASGSENFNVVITLRNSKFVTTGYTGSVSEGDKDDCPVMINVPGKLFMDGCTVSGNRQAVVVRGGTAVITGGKIDASGAKDIMITMPYNGIPATCLFYGTPEKWRCERFSYQDYVGAISVSPKEFDLLVYSQKPSPNRDDAIKQLLKLAPRGHIDFEFADIAGTYDVNGDKKPNPSTYSTNERTYQIYTGGEAAELNDLFIIMITDTSAIPYGELAQSVVYN